MWTLKAKLRGFELVSELTINLYKSKIYGVGMKDYHLEAFSSFLGCKIDSIPFKFLEFTVGGIHKRIALWKPVLRSLKPVLEG